MTEAKTDKADVIRQCYLFAEAGAQSLGRLAAQSQFETVPKRKAIFAEGDASDGLRIVVSGLVRIWINDAEGRELTLNLMEAGDAFGEIALLDGAARTANATAEEPTRYLLLRQSSFDAVLAEEPALARHLIALLCERVRANTADLYGFAFQDMQARLAGKLYELALSHSEMPGDNTARFTRKFSQTELAAMLGATREAINKRLAALSGQGVVAIEGGWLTILDLQALRRLAVSGAS
jgi:CRP-like cAMP-binding protein